MSVPVQVTIGIGGWKVHWDGKLIACPHVGDLIDIGHISVTCERVCITSTVVYVEQTVRFHAESDMDEYVKLGWKR